MSGFFRVTQKLVLKQRLAYIPLTIVTSAVWGCSGRSVTNDNSSSKIIQTLIANSNGAADAKPKDNALAISLVSLPADETMLETFSSAIDAPGATHYRAAVVTGYSTACDNLGALKPISELLSVPVGKAGEKKLCIQAAHEKGQFGEVSHFNFIKRDAPGDSPELNIPSAPQWLTSSSSAIFSVASQDAIQFRARFMSIPTATTPCRTLEDVPWKDVSESISLKFEYDVIWQFCVEVRDQFGRKSKAPKSFVWIRDTINPVVTPLSLPDGPTTEKQFSLTVKGNLADFYQHVFVEGTNNCSSVNYPPLVPVTTPLNLQIPKDGTWTLCLMTEAKSGQRQQAPYVKTIQAVSPIVTPVATAMPDPVATKTPVTPDQPTASIPVAKVTINPVSVNASKVPLSTSRAFTISGTGVTHYKSFTYDFSNNCPATPPATAAVEISVPLRVSFSSGGIKSVCVWGITRSSAGSEVSQAIPTWFRFYNDTSYSMIGKRVTNPTPYTALQAWQSCRCHDLFDETDWKNRALETSGRIRNDSMPKSGWIGKDAEKAGLMAFLATVSGYPVDMPYVIVNP